MMNELKKVSFLSDIVGLENYKKIRSDWKWPLAIYTMSALLLFGLTTVCYSRIVSYLFSLLVGFNLFFIAYLYLLIVSLDIQVVGRGFGKEKGEKPSTGYICTIIWFVSLLLMGLFAVWKTEKLRKDYAFDCKTIWIERSGRIYHIWDYCESMNSCKKVKGHEIDRGTYHLCGECQDISDGEREYTY